MAAAILLTVGLPFFFLMTVALLVLPFAWLQMPSLALVALLAALSLGVAVYRARREPDQRYWLFLIPFAVSEVAVGLATLLRGQLAGDGPSWLSDLADFSLVAFALVQVAVPTYLIYVLKGSRFTALAFTIFSITYAAFAVAVGAMS